MRRRCRRRVSSAARAELLPALLVGQQVDQLAVVGQFARQFGRRHPPLPAQPHEAEVAADRVEPAAEVADLVTAGLDDQLLEELHHHILGIGPVAQQVQRHAVDQLRMAEVKLGQMLRAAVGPVAGQQFVVVRAERIFLGELHGWQFLTDKVTCFFSCGFVYF